MRLSASLDFAAAGDDSAARDWSARDTPALAQRMDAAAFQVFYAKAAPGLRGYIRRASGNEALAEESGENSPAKYRRPALHCPRRGGYSLAVRAPPWHRKLETPQRPCAGRERAYPAHSNRVRPNRLRPLRSPGSRSTSSLFVRLAAFSWAKKARRELPLRRSTSSRND